MNDNKYQPPISISVGWQTIETAPTDGRDLILTHPDWNGDIMVGSFAFGKWRECPSPDGESIIPTHWMHIPPLTSGPAPSPTRSDLTRLSICIGGEGTPGGAYAFTEADDDGDYCFFTEALAAISASEGHND